MTTNSVELREGLLLIVGTATLDRTNTSGSLTFMDEGDNSSRIRDWLTNWFKKRPAVETLRAKGILQGEALWVKLPTE